MAQNELFRGFQREFFRALQDRPLNLMEQADRDLYVNLHDEGHSPVDRLFRGIDFAGAESLQLVTGFRGTGKSTGFSELERRLWEAGYHVIRVDLDGYIDRISPIDIREFMLITAGAISDRLAEEKLLGKQKASGLSYWERIKKLVPSLQEVSASLGPIEIKAGLAGDRSFREKIRTSLANRLGELTQNVREYYADLLQALKDSNTGRDVRLVIILDSLEHIRGSDPESGKAVRKSVLDLFLHDAKRIALPNLHVVVSVPAFMAMEANNLAAQYLNGVCIWPAYRVTDRSGHPTETVQRIQRLVERRGDWKRILPNDQALHDLILASGGHLRDLFRMLIEAVMTAEGGPPDPHIAERVKAVAQRAYLPLYKEEIAILGCIARDKKLDNIGVEQQEFLLRFLDAGLLLCYLNDDFWYDVHPLVRGKVSS